MHWIFPVFRCSDCWAIGKALPEIEFLDLCLKASTILTYTNSLMHMNTLLHIWTCVHTFIYQSDPFKLSINLSIYVHFSFSFSLSISVCLSSLSLYLSVIYLHITLSICSSFYLSVDFYSNWFTQSTNKSQILSYIYLRGVLKNNTIFFPDCWKNVAGKKRCSMISITPLAIDEPVKEICLFRSLFAMSNGETIYIYIHAYVCVLTHTRTHTHTLTYIVKISKVQGV